MTVGHFYAIAQVFTERDPTTFPSRSMHSCGEAGQYLMPKPGTLQEHKPQWIMGELRTHC